MEKLGAFVVRGIVKRLPVGRPCTDVGSVRREAAKVVECAEVKGVAVGADVEGDAIAIDTGSAESVEAPVDDLGISRTDGDTAQC